MKYYVTELASAITKCNNLNNRAVDGGAFTDGITSKICEILELKTGQGAIPIIEENQGKYLQYYTAEQLAEQRELTWYETNDCHEDLEFQIYLTHKNNTILTKEVPAIYEYWKTNDIDTYVEDEGVYMYVNYILDEHRALLTGYGAIINEKPI
jgi:hypothetical protein